MERSENLIESTGKVSEDDESILKFLDSMESYLTLMDSLSSALRQGWFELASARHSMGVSRVNSALFDLKSHNASMTLQVHEHDGSSDVEPYLTLCKWTSSDEPEVKLEDELASDKSDIAQTPKHHEETREAGAESAETPEKDDSQAEKERIKSLSMFGKLVSPKLRTTQSSFEKALEMLVEISNVRASLLCAHDQVKNRKSTE